MAGKAIRIRWTLTFAAMQADIIALMVSFDNFLREFTGYCSARFWTVPARGGQAVVGCIFVSCKFVQIFALLVLYLAHWSRFFVGASLSRLS